METDQFRDSTLRLCFWIILFEFRKCILKLSIGMLFSGFGGLEVNFASKVN
ncbi:hypothetical protein Godav_024020, partial [Gossypium davidsonii]|nr:hypothetical protein [Gossypium davidsonii]MBA0665141.1 hypothetical protein [Gossypium klotzschianum]